MGCSIRVYVIHNDDAFLTKELSDDLELMVHWVDLELSGLGDDVCSLHI